MVNAMEEAKFEQGATVITEGEPGAVLYIVEEGQLDCYKKVSDSVSEPYLAKIISLNRDYLPLLDLNEINN